MSSLFVVAAGILGLAGSVHAEETTTLDLRVSMTSLSDRFAGMEAEVISVVNDAAALYQEYGQDGLGMITAGADVYDAGTAYPFVLDLNTQEVVAHGAIREHVGRTSVSLTASDKPFDQIKAELESDGSSWLMYTFINPGTGKNQTKVSFVALHDDYVFGSGFYLADLEAGMIIPWRTANSAAALYDVNGQSAFEMINRDSTSYDASAAYAFVVDTNTDTLVAHGVDPGQVGGGIIDTNKSPGQEQLELATNNGIWVSYTFLNPYSGNEELKVSWLTVRDNYAFGSGFYPTDYVAKEVGAVMAVDEALYMYVVDGHDAFAKITALDVTGTAYPFVIVAETAEQVADGSVLDRRGQVAWQQHELRAAVGDIMETLESGQGAWSEYVFVNPDTGKNQAKKTWFVLHDGYLFGAGFYLTGESAQIVEMEWSIATTMELYRELGAEDAFARVNALQSTVEIYPFIFDSDLVLVAHGANTGLLGEALSDLARPDKSDEQIRDELASDGASLIRYAFANPATGHIEQKVSLLMAYDGYVFGSGYYSEAISTTCR